MFHSTTVVGRLGRDPEMRYTPAGKPVTSFSVAVDDGYGEHKKTVWFKVTAWDKQAETCQTYLHKGDIVLVEGRLQATDKGECRTWQGQDGTTHASFELQASTVRFIQTKRDQEGEGEPAPAAAAGGAEVPF